VVDSLLPDGVPVPCSFLIAADPGSGTEVISASIMRAHLSSNQEALWLSFENPVDDLRNNIDYVSIANKPRVQFIDCYSSQLGIDSREKYNVDPSNLPYLSMVTSNAISEMNGSGRLLVILDSLTSLIQKVGVRRSTEFFRTLVGKTRSISADLLTTLNRAAFSEATLATFADIADLVLELVVQDTGTSAGKLRIRKARNVRHLKSWRAYEVDLERRTLRCELQESLELDKVSKSKKSNGPSVDSLETGPFQFDPRSDHDLDDQLEPSLNMRCEGPYCTFGGRALSGRERLAIMIETMGVMGKKYQDLLQVVVDSVAKNRRSGDDSTSDDLLKYVYEQMQKVDRVVKLVQNRSEFRPSFCRPSRVEELTQRALADFIFPSNVEVMRESEASIEIHVDPYMTIRALSAVIEASVQEMPSGGYLSIKDFKDGDMAIIVVTNDGLGRLKYDLSEILDPENSLNALAGLGLVVARRFIESQKGQLRIESETGKGTTFTIMLPLKPR
jgi:archaellum biogenesis ATPase FlaH